MKGTFQMLNIRSEYPSSAAIWTGSMDLADLWNSNNGGEMIFTLDVIYRMTLDTRKIT